MDEKRWSDAKLDYVTTDMTYRQIADKYGVPKSTAEKRGAKEKWNEARQAYSKRVETKSLEKISNDEANRYKKLISVADLALEKLIARLKDPELDEKGLRAVFASLKDYKDVTSVRSSADAREQDAHIANLERQANSDEKTNDGGVVIEIEGLPEAWRE